ncbi:MAG: hypothetical protein KatS3mg003_1888 [Candidatus Nitrosocaldaceae archaeon]|nr:MAG: hypothetical protein KatS3mg003_1443 [Candidatus Nitrosocaldaceae archaeon]GIU72409.1 MAG: hypothetical protein KatS3mg003_1888 [Candidatus Nitrosocaldaceae archaeon]
MKNSNFKLYIMLAALVAINIVVAEEAYSTHYYTGHRWLFSTINVCYDSYSLKNVNIDGSTNQFSKVASELDQGRASWNNLPSQFTLNRVSSCNNWVTGEYHNTDWLGKVVSQYQFGYIVDADMIINTKYNFKTAPECNGSTYGYTLDYVARHEWGHYVEFNDYPFTVMHPSYDCNRWNGIDSHTSSSVSNIYG